MLKDSIVRCGRVSSRSIFLVITSLLVGGSWPVIAQTPSCTPLNVIGGKGGTQVKKTISPPGLLVSRNNWNTDFAVPGGANYSKYKATIIADNLGEYNIEVYLKYSDKTSDQIYKNTKVPLKKGEPLIVTGAPSSSSKQPYQVNIQVGGATKVGKTYIASVVGCP